MLVRHIMCTEVFSVLPETPIQDALRALQDRRIRRAPVLDGAGKLVGFITERDLLKATPGSVGELNTADGLAAAARSVDQIASKSVTCAHPDDHIEDLAAVFLEKKIGGVPVVEQEQLVGVVTESDIFRAIVGAPELADTTRITVQCGKAPASRTVQKVVRFLKLDLVGLAQYTSSDDREVFVLKVRGERSKDLGPELTRAGWIMLDRRAAS